MRGRREKRGQTVQEFIRSAVGDELSRLVETLGMLGLEPLTDDARAATLPLDDRLLGDLKVASGATGVPQSQLFDAQHFRSIYSQHWQNVLLAFRNQTGRLLVYDVRDGWGPLCRFLAVEEPEQAVPQLNQGRT
jgi:hypothetical protein